MARSNSRSDTSPSAAASRYARLTLPVRHAIRPTRWEMAARKASSRLGCRGASPKSGEIADEKVVAGGRGSFAETDQAGHGLSRADGVKRSRRRGEGGEATAGEPDQPHMATVLLEREARRR